MARTKSKTDIKKVTVKKTNTSNRKKTTTPLKKASVPKKKIVLDDNDLVEKTINRKTTVSDATGKIPVKKIKNIKKEEASNLTKEEIVAKRKERNRKKYQNQQKKYQDSKSKTKKSVATNTIDDISKLDEKEVNEEIKKIEKELDEETKKIDLTEETKEIKINKKKKKIELEEDFDKIEIDNKKIDTEISEDTKEIIPVKEDLIEQEEQEEDKSFKEERKEKRKTNRKADYFTQTITNIKTKSVDTITIVKEKTTDKTIPVGKTREDKKSRKKRFLKEAIVYSIALTIINVLCIIIFDYFNFLRLFDVKVLNVIVTILISLIFNFFIAFMVDYFVTDIWLKKKRKEDGEQHGNSGINEEKH